MIEPEWQVETQAIRDDLGQAQGPSARAVDYAPGFPTAHRSPGGMARRQPGAKGQTGGLDRQRDAGDVWPDQRDSTTQRLDRLLRGALHDGAGDEGLPLYFFSGDSKPGDTKGNYTGWSLVKP